MFTLHRFNDEEETQHISKMRLFLANIDEKLGYMARQYVITNAIAHGGGWNCPDCDLVCATLQDNYR